jgi:hypothetical protein
MYRGPNLLAHVPIPIDEWRIAVSQFASFRITDNLAVENPFTKEVLFAALPGSGLWKRGGVSDDAIHFRFVGGTATFLRFSDLDNRELVSLAHTLNAHLELHRTDE